MIEVAVSNAHPGLRVAPAAVRRIVEAVLRNEGRRGGAVSVVLVGDLMSRRIHRRFFSLDRPTDVMSFPLGEGENLEGEIYVNLDKAARQARIYGVSTANEVARLIVHGVLHLAGYDDRAPSGARLMKERENRHVAVLAGEDTRPR